jgi:hypothetical protein
MNTNGRNSGKGLLLAIILLVVVAVILSSGVTRLVIKDKWFQFNKTVAKNISTEGLYQDRMEDLQKDREALVEAKITTAKLQAEILLAEKSLATAKANKAKNEAILKRGYAILSANGVYGGQTFDIQEVSAGVKTCIEHTVPRYKSEIKMLESTIRTFRTTYTANLRAIQTKEIELESALAKLKLEKQKIEHQETLAKIDTFVDSFSVRLEADKKETTKQQEWDRRVIMAEVGTQMLMPIADQDTPWYEDNTQPAVKDNDQLLAQLDDYFAEESEAEAAEHTVMTADQQ